MMEKKLVDDFTNLIYVMSKFSIHIERRLINIFFEDYRKHVQSAHQKFFRNELIIEKMKGISIYESEIGTSNPGDIKLNLQKDIKELITELRELTLSSC